ncbi:MAG: hypothetical protein L0H96_22880 [Humibacillus sp.]|nr:hypothetical protein [Humibacillus sp.]MDN5779736.1 hypothetical protein [Humibacillus sp.]
MITTHGQNIAIVEGERVEAGEWTGDVLVRSSLGWMFTLTQLAHLSCVTGR